MKNLDFKKEHINEAYYTADQTPVIVEMPEIKYLMIDGQGDPTVSKEFQEAMDLLKKIASLMTTLIKKWQQVDRQVMPLEGLWWMNDVDYNNLSRDNWKWTLMIMQPDFFTEKMLTQIIDSLRGSNPISVFQKLCVNTLTEGLSAQIRHIGPFVSEGPTVDKLHYYIFRNGYIMNGKHHEIYLSDTQNTDLKDWQTIIRQPIRRRK